MNGEDKDAGTKQGCLIRTYAECKSDITLYLVVCEENGINMRDRLQEASRVGEVTSLNTSFPPDQEDLQQLFSSSFFFFLGPYSSELMKLISFDRHSSEMT